MLGALDARVPVVVAQVPLLVGADGQTATRADRSLAALHRECDCDAQALMRRAVAPSPRGIEPTVTLAVGRRAVLVRSRPPMEGSAAAGAVRWIAIASVSVLVIVLGLVYLRSELRSDECGGGFGCVAYHAVNAEVAEDCRARGLDAMAREFGTGFDPYAVVWAPTPGSEIRRATGRTGAALAVLESR
jgi:hypothetical protein